MTPVNKIIYRCEYILFIWGLIMLLHTAAAQSSTALQLSCKVADKVIRDTRFEWKQVAGKEVLGMQVIDFGFMQLQSQQKAYAMRYARVASDTLVRFGITSANHIQVWINKQLVWQQDTCSVVNPDEFAYDRFNFQHYFTASLHKGDNEILISYIHAPVKPVVFLRAVTVAGDQDQSVDFSAQIYNPRWLYAGPFPVAASLIIIQPVYSLPGKFIYWQSAPQIMLPELVIDSQATYRRESYADWHYAHGTAVWSIQGLEKVTGYDHYKHFIEKYTGFLLDNYACFQWQYDSLYAWRGSYHRVFRRTMLDDAGAAALPFAELFRQQKDSALITLLTPLAQYIRKEQVRLKDGTFCRPEPVNFTVWADDLFMGVPFLLTMASATGEKAYLEDAVKQVKQFRKYLLDPATGLYKHGWFSNTGQQSVAFWGRANGWIVWANAELLDVLPPEHPAYKEILKAFRHHMSSLLPYQAADGMWRQLLNRPASYEETSCTAMITLAMARGIRKGWLPETYTSYALKAWRAIAAKIDDDGTVHGICQGTAIGSNEQFYLKRKTIDHDPRGLGAVIIAGVEIAKLQ